MSCSTLRSFVWTGRETLFCHDCDSSLFLATMRDLDTFSKAYNHDSVTLAILLSLRSLGKIPLEFCQCVSLLLIMIPVEAATAAFNSVGLQNQAK